MQRLREYETEDRVPKRYKEEVKAINRGIYIVWDKKINRWRVKHEDDRTGLVRDILIAENPNTQEYQDLDMSVIRMLKDQVMWNLVEKFKDPKDIYAEIVKERNYRKWKAEMDHRDYRMQWNKDHKTEWKAAVENLKRGITYIPEETKRKIIMT